MTAVHSINMDNNSFIIHFQQHVFISLLPSSVCVCLNIFYLTSILSEYRLWYFTLSQHKLSSFIKSHTPLLFIIYYYNPLYIHTLLAHMQNEHTNSTLTKDVIKQQTLKHNNKSITDSHFKRFHACSNVTAENIVNILAAKLKAVLVKRQDRQNSSEEIKSSNWSQELYAALLQTVSLYEPRLCVKNTEH